MSRAESGVGRGDRVRFIAHCPGFHFGAMGTVMLDGLRLGCVRVRFDDGNEFWVNRNYLQFAHSPSLANYNKKELEACHVKR